MAFSSSSPRQSRILPILLLFQALYGKKDLLPVAREADTHLRKVLDLGGGWLKLVWWQGTLSPPCPWRRLLPRSRIHFEETSRKTQRGHCAAVQQRALHVYLHPRSDIKCGTAPLACRCRGGSFAGGRAALGSHSAALRRGLGGWWVAGGCSRSVAGGCCRRRACLPRKVEGHLL
jgi:hypothetical protein